MRTAPVIVQVHYTSSRARGEAGREIAALIAPCSGRARLPRITMLRALDDPGAILLHER